MNMQSLFESEVIEWHRSQGGAGIRPAGHALRILQECVELCVASGASEAEIKMAVRRECDKATDRSEFTRPKVMEDAIEEFVDVKILLIVFQSYFLSHPDFEKYVWRKLRVHQQRQWKADADGVLWRPGTKPAVPDGEEPKAPKTG